MDPPRAALQRSFHGEHGFGAWLDAMGRHPNSVNVGSFLGAANVRAYVMGQAPGEPNAAQLDSMRAVVRNSMRDGAFGVASALIYPPGSYAATHELIEMAKAMAPYHGEYITHMRSEDDSLFEAMDEAFRIGRHARVPVAVSHLKCAGRENWGRSAEVLDALEQAGRTHPVGCDAYPYTAGSSTLDLKQVTDAIEITITWSEPHPEMGGRSLKEIARAWDASLMDAARRLRPAGAIYHSMSEDDVRRILRHPATVIGSDGLPNDPNPHPRLWGAFPRVLGHYARDERLFPLAEAVHKMTGLPARKFGLSQRGLVREGYAADLVLFDAATVRDVATFADPQRPAEGIAAVWVNGVLTSRDQVATGARGGRFLARGTIDPADYYSAFTSTTTETQRA
jgi:N-acyl-D-amino-acid deacylase